VPSTKEADRKRPAFGAGNEIRTHDFNLGKKDDLPGRTSPLDLIAEIRALSAQEDAIRRRREGLIAALQDALAPQPEGGRHV
jgi:hypothetical protein